MTVTSPERSGCPPFMVRTAGENLLPPGAVTIGSKQGDIILRVPLTPGATYRSLSGVLSLEPGMIGLIPDEEPGFIVAPSDRCFAQAWCRFSGDYAMQTARRIIDRHKSRFFPTARHADVLECIRAMGQHFGFGPSPVMGQREVLLARALVLLDEEVSTRPRTAVDEETLKVYVQNHIYEPIDVAKAARELGMHRCSFSRAAHRLLGKSLSQLLEELKVMRAKEMMATEERSIKEIAYRLGFSHPSYFGRVFKKHTGYSPRHWLDRYNRRAAN